MRRWILILLITVFALASTSCVTYIAFWHRPRYAPAYCYDCHHRPRWVRVYTNCDYYVFRVVGDGYYYKRRNAKHADYVYKKYDRKIVRERQKEDREYREKYKKNRKSKDEAKHKKKHSPEEEGKKPRRGK
ncbi:MAG: hypothetical protein B6D58_07120 [candidate division Zixibacteria bacterium 4484_95]|nr:MAG: hypothetical protein B6D58_07120 [candidate division Zixibacteria bacterium 4484_95]RKX18068.1 MAG: hypothetical protein DRP26_05895 [candidate division Zixibacteria bacterium]